MEGQGSMPNFDENNKDFVQSKFGDFLTDENIEFDESEISDNSQNTDIIVDVPSYVATPPEQPDDKISNAIDRLMCKLGLDIDNYDPSQVLDNIEKINSDDITFDLAASKVVGDLTSRVTLKGVVVSAMMTDKIWDFLAKQYGSNASALDAESLLLIDKATSYLDKLFAIQDRYKRSGVVESLKHIATQKQRETSTSEEKITLTTADIQRLIKQAQQSDTSKPQQSTNKNPEPYTQSVDSQKEDDAITQDPFA